MDLGTNHNSTQLISRPDPEFENASEQIEIDFCISFDVLLILESQRGWCELSRDGSYSSVAKLMYFRVTLDSQLKKNIPVGYLSKVNFRVDSRRCPKAILPRSDPAAIRSRHDFEFLWKVFFFYSSSSSSCLTSSLFAAGSSRLKYLPVTYFCDCSVRAEELERGKKSDIFSKYITRQVIQRRLTLSMIG